MSYMQLRAHSSKLTAALVFAASACIAGAQTLIDNDQVRVERVVDQPHKKSDSHEHKLNRVMVYMQSGAMAITSADGKKEELQWKSGDVKWSPSAGKHVSEVTSDAPVTLIEVEIKKPGDPRKKATTALDPLRVDPKVYKLEFENAQVRVTRVRMAAHQSVPTHEHLLNRVVVYVSDQNTAMTTPDGKTTVSQHKAHEASWGEAVKHKENNLMDKPFEAVVIELKS